MISVILVLISTFAYGADKPASSGPLRPVIWTKGFYGALKARFPASQFEYLDPQTRRKDLLKQGYLQPLERDALFRKLNLETKLQQMDEMDKDMLVMGAKFYSVPELVKQYPMLSGSQLRRLKTEVEKIK
jgi:hypothetical protein